MRYNLAIASWNQLVRKSSQHYLDFDNDYPPINLVFDEEDRGLAIIDCGILDNCGFGVGDVLFYEILDVEM